MAVLTSLTSLICTFPLFGHNHLFVCMIGWKPEMGANGLHHSHVPDFVWKITSTQILQVFLPSKSVDKSKLIFVI